MSIDLDCTVQEVTETELARAIEQNTEVPATIAERLAQMYFEYSDAKEETVGQVLENLEVGADISVLKNSQKSKAES